MILNVELDTKQKCREKNLTINKARRARKREKNENLSTGALERLMTYLAVTFVSLHSIFIYSYFLFIHAETFDIEFRGEYGMHVFNDKGGRHASLVMIMVQRRELKYR